MTPPTKQNKQQWKPQGTSVCHVRVITRNGKQKLKWESETMSTLMLSRWQQRGFAIVAALLLEGLRMLPRSIFLQNKFTKKVCHPGESRAGRSFVSGGVPKPELVLQLAANSICLKSWDRNDGSLTMFSLRQHLSKQEQSIPFIVSPDGLFLGGSPPKKEVWNSRPGLNWKQTKR